MQDWKVKDMMFELHTIFMRAVKTGSTIPIVVTGHNLAEHEWEPDRFKRSVVMVPIAAYLAEEMELRPNFAKLTAILTAPAETLVAQRDAYMDAIAWDYAEVYAQGLIELEWME